MLFVVGCAKGNLTFFGREIANLHVHFHADMQVESVNECLQICHTLQCSMAAFTRDPTPTCLMQLSPMRSRACDSLDPSLRVPTWNLADDKNVLLIQCIQCGSFNVASKLFLCFILINIMTAFLHNVFLKKLFKCAIALNDLCLSALRNLRTNFKTGLVIPTTVFL